MGVTFRELLDHPSYKYAVHLNGIIFIGQMKNTNLVSGLLRVRFTDRLSAWAPIYHNVKFWGCKAQSFLGGI